jgi:hypothetical protein
MHGAQPNKKFNFFFAPGCAETELQFLNEIGIQKQDLFYFGVITSGHNLFWGGNNLLFFFWA